MKVGSAAGAQVSGSAITQADVDLVGKHGRIVIPPPCGLEPWDMLTIVDMVANQNTIYHVVGYTFECNARRGIYLHTLDLCAP